MYPSEQKKNRKTTFHLPNFITPGVSENGIVTLLPVL